MTPTGISYISWNLPRIKRQKSYILIRLTLQDHLLGPESIRDRDKFFRAAFVISKSPKNWKDKIWSYLQRAFLLKGYVLHGRACLKAVKYGEVIQMGDEKNFIRIFINKLFE